MGDAQYSAAIEIRPAVPKDADGIARTFLESAEYHAELDSERYLIPALETTTALYREGWQHPRKRSNGPTVSAIISSP